MTAPTFRYSRLFTSTLALAPACGNFDSGAGDGVDTTTTDTMATDTMATASMSSSDSAGLSSDASASASIDTTHGSSGSISDSGTAETSGSHNGSSSVSNSGSDGGSTASSDSSDSSSSSSSDSDLPVVHWHEDFEAGFNGWTRSGSVWEVGNLGDPNGPTSHGGTGVAGTALAGNYPAGTYTTWLYSPTVEVPLTQGLRLYFWDWYDLQSQDWASFAIRPEGGQWQYMYWGGRSTREWRRHGIGMQAYAGTRVQFALGLQSTDNLTASGWYVDDFSLESGEGAAKDTSFEEGFEGWSEAGGIWDIGQPTDAAGPKAQTGTSVAGTVLDASYPSTLWGSAYQAILYSPEFLVPMTAAAPTFGFWHWYELNGSAYGQVRVQVEGAAWQSLGSAVQGSSANMWVEQTIDLASYKGKRISLSFSFVPNASAPAPGWFIDDVSYNLN